LDSLNGEKNLSRFLIIGPGAVGLAIGARLQLLGCKPQFLRRLQVPEGEVRHFLGWNQSQNLELKVVLAADWPRFDLVFCAVKAFQLQQVLDEHLPKLRPGCVVVPVANGATLEMIERCQSQFPNLVLRAGYCLLGATVIGKGTYKLTSESSRVIWGPSPKAQTVQPTPTEVALIGKDCDKFFEFSPNVQLGIAKKWVFNVVVNTICASQGYSKNKMLLADKDFLKRVFTEAFALQELIWPQSNLSDDGLWSELLNFIDIFGENENSMQRDIVAGRQTESLYLAGMSLKYKEFPLLRELHGRCTAPTRA
jgi:ketopantoate reductase